MSHRRLDRDERRTLALMLGAPADTAMMTEMGDAIATRLRRRGMIATVGSVPPYVTSTGGWHARTWIYRLTPRGRHAAERLHANRRATIEALMRGPTNVVEYFNARRVAGATDQRTTPRDPSASE